MADDEKPMPARREEARRLAPGVLLTWSERPDPEQASEAYGHQNAALIQYRAATLADLAAHVTSEAGKPKRPYAGDPSSRTAPRKDTWDLGAGWNGALEIAGNGWKEGRKAISDALATIPGDLVLNPPQLADVAGGVLDCAAHVAGAPDCFDVDDDEAAGQARVVRLIVPMSAAGMTPAERLMNRGAAIASVIDALEAARISCEVEALSVHEANSTYDQVAVRHLVKHAGDPLNLDALASSIAHPATFRRLHFAALESIGDFNPGFRGGFKPADIQSGYGMPRPYKAMTLEHPGTYLLPDYSAGDYSTPTAARASVAEAMRALGFSVTFKTTPEHAPR